MVSNVSAVIPKSSTPVRTQTLKIRLSKAEESRIKASSDRACVAAWARDVLLSEQGYQRRPSKHREEHKQVLPPLRVFSDDELKAIGQLTAAIACLNAAIWRHECCDYDVVVFKLINNIEKLMTSKLYDHDY